MATIPAGWTEEKTGLRKTFVLADFKEALAFVVEAGRLAEAVNHHPDIDIRWNKVTLVLFTHDAKAVTAKDYSMAEKVNGLAINALKAKVQTLF
jgi:4a-hydroxytetrahydrobiopterin dehydratase